MENKIIINPAKTLGGEVFVPASKSYAQRAVVIAALAAGVSEISGIDPCEDSLAALRVVRSMGAEVTDCGQGRYRIQGTGFTLRSDCFDIGESGLSTRLFVPAAALFGSQITITGRGSVMSRPMDFMKKPMEALGTTFSSNGGFLPLTIQGPMHGGEIEVDGSQGSQFLSGLLIALPLLDQDTVIRVTNLTSKPYIDMTLDIMRQFGVNVEHTDYKIFNIPGRQAYRARAYTVEGDWSSASCLIAAGVMCPGEVTLRNLDPWSKQADKAILQALDFAGADFSVTPEALTVRKSRLKGFCFDATDCPDLFPALVAMAAAADGESRIAGTLRLEHKESDRARALKEVYETLGVAIDLSHANLMFIRPGVLAGGCTLDSRNDHRIAMTIAVSALRAADAVTITRCEAVNKSYPGFWDDLMRITK